MDIYTIGHYTHTKESFLTMLARAEIETLIDVRTFPASRKFPQFNQHQMEEWLQAAEINYYHLTDLAGRRNKSSLVQDELNSG